MTCEEAALAVIDALEALHIPYMVVGSFSSNYYGIGRSTKDADFVVQLDPASTAQMWRCGGIMTHFLAHLGTAAAHSATNSFHIDRNCSTPAIPTACLFGSRKLWQEVTLHFCR